MQYHNILRDYVREYAIPAMLREGWAFKAAKSYGWSQAARGPEYHVDQPLRTHIINGLYALTRVLEYLKDKGYYRIIELDFKRVLVLYTLHDAYKDSNLANTRTGTSDFDIPLAALDDLIERMQLRGFAQVKAEDIRAASVSLQSQRVADLTACTPGITHLLTLVHLADAFASQQTASDFSTAENRLRELMTGTALTNRQNARTSQRMGVPLPAYNAPPALRFYYHELDDYRGLSTLLIHQATEEALAPSGLYPVLYFANGILYLGPETLEIEVDALRKQITTGLFARVREEAQDESYSIAIEACDPRKGLKIARYAYLFCRFEHLLEAAQEKTSLTKPAGFINKLLAKRIDKGKYTRAEEFYTRYDIPPNADKNEAQARHWLAASKLMMAAESIADALVPGNSLEWLFSIFNTPAPIAATIRQHSKALRDGGVSDHCMIIAYHWLLNTSFTAKQRSWLEVETADIQRTITALLLRALKPYEKIDTLLAFVEEELGFESDTQTYLASHLTFSFAVQRGLDEDPLIEYEKERKQSHKRLCMICSRPITSHIVKKSSEIKTTIADMQAQVFSNKRVPTDEVNNMMVWCPMCYLEFMLRKLSGQSYPVGSDYNASYRLHLYVLPDYSFTPQLWEATAQDLLMNFHPRETTVSKLKLRGSRDDPGLPARWLQHHMVDQEWLDQVSNMFANQAAYMKTPTKEGKPRGKHGDRLSFSFKHPNYMLITYDNVVSERADTGLHPTHIEVWTKALYAATLIHLLTGARVYITDKPYLNITRPEQMKTIIEMEGLHPLMYGLLPMRRTDSEATGVDLRASQIGTRLPIATLPVMLDLLAAVWEINAALYQGRPNERRNLDKQVANIVETVKTNYLAGATLYKMLERDKATLYPVFTRACQVLLPQRGDRADATRQALFREGYELMIDKEGGALMNLAQKITDTSLKLYLPGTKREGRAHRFESIFRTGVEVIKTNATADDDILVAKVAGNILKRLERISGGARPTYGPAQVEAVQYFAELLVKELFGQVCRRSVSKLTHQENSLADAIFFLTMQQINARWDDYKKREPKRAEEALAADDEDVIENSL
ncbi:MAG: type I-D CRISPR-associated protein Cas10d/Csc3 [Ktedonobacteraceae bacterium]|nr:type I-D CRISPR-associated protein Cas10d/Csc3 [Ktedonobacteraceae bacterium]